MNVVIWARVSSREQEVEGYSLEAQLRATRERAKANGWNILREYSLHETGRRAADRQKFNEMFNWVKANAKREKIGAILSHRLDRVCRNMRDAIRVQDLEDSHQVGLVLIENEFGRGAAGTFTFNVMAAVAQYYSDNLRAEVLKGLNEKAAQGWCTGAAPYGYMNVKGNKEEPIQPDPVESHTLARIFQLYSTGGHTYKSLADLLLAEGHRFQPAQPRFGRTALEYILSNRFYIGEIHRNGSVFEGRYKRVIDRATFNACENIRLGRNRRTGTPEHPLAGGLFRCEYCGQSITGERILRKLKGGGVREHLYYRCANNHPGPEHPKVRWKAEALDQAIVEDLESMRISDPEVATWFRTELTEAVRDLTSHKRRQAEMLTKRKSELANMQDRLLNAYLGGSVEEDAYKAKTTQLKADLANVGEALAQLGEVDATRGTLVTTLFDWTQHAADIWRGSNNAVRRQILDSVCLNRTLGDVSLVTQKRKPFDAFTERLTFAQSRGTGHGSAFPTARRQQAWPWHSAIRA